jgi:AraC-like DNA-binding protein
MKLFISFIILIVVPIIAIYELSSQETARSSENTIGQNSVNNLRTADKNMEQLARSCRKDCLNLVREADITSVASYTSEFDPSNLDEVLTVQNTVDYLMKMTQNDDDYSSVYLYIEGNPYVFTSDNGPVHLTDMTDSGWMDYYKKYKNDFIQVSFTGTHRLGEHSGENTASHGFITTYIYPLTSYITTFQGAVIINIKSASINRIINGGTNINDTVMIADGGGSVIAGDNSRLCSNISGQPYAARALKSKSASGYFVSKVGSADCLVSYYKSSINDWCYIGSTPVSYMLKSQQDIKRRMLIMMTATILIFAAIAYFVSKKIYSPVEAVIKTIKSRNAGAGGEYGNEDEFSLILKALDTGDKGTGGSEEAIRRKLLEDGIVKLIADDYPDDESKKALDEYFSRCPCICALLSIDKYGAAGGQTGEKQWRYLKTLLLKLADDVIGAQYKWLGFSFRKGQIMFIFGIQGRHSAEYIKNIRSLFVTLSSEVSKAMESSITVGFGAPRDGVCDIRGSYIEAETALEQRLKVGFGQIIDYDARWDDCAYYYPFEAEEKIRDCLNLGLTEELKKEISALTEDLKVRPRLSCENIIQIISGLMGSTITKYMIEHHINPNDAYGMNFDIYSEVAGMETLDEMRDMLTEKYTKLIDFSSKDKDRKKYVNRIVEYIRSHYKEDIGVTEITDQVGLSYSHARKLFKDEIGVNIVDYINSLRIRDAKELLISTDTSVKNIAVALGYNNDQSFERNFKKIVGITPGEFRLKTKKS